MIKQTLKPQAVFPDLPRGSPFIVKMPNGDYDMHPYWKLFFDNLVMALQVNFKPEGIVVPSQTAADIALLVGTTSNPQSSFNNIVYDSTNSQFKGNIAGTWKTFTLT